MISRLPRFNINLLLLGALVALIGCQSPETKREKQLATVRIYLEVSTSHPGQKQQVSVLRASPIILTVEKSPFLNEIHVASASVVDAPGGFQLSIRFNTKGKWLLEQYTAANPNRRFAIRSQWGVAPDVQDRFVAARLNTGRIKDGVLTFTPDATRDDAAQIAIGLNNFAGDTMLKERGSLPEDTGGTK
jgi:preprotein translocase subunit SecD